MIQLLGIGALGILILAGITGCVSKTKARLQAEEAYRAGQQSVLMMQQETNPGQPQVQLRGFFKQNTLNWVEGLTLAQAILEAEFTANWEPYQVILVSQGIAQRILIRDMLSGRNNPVLKPGDLIEIRR